MNKVLIMGRLGRDPEIKYSAGGVAFCNLSVATDDSFTRESGEKVKTTEWHTVVVFGRMAEAAAQYLTKGLRVLVEGSIATRNWKDNNGNERYATEIRAKSVQFIDRKAEGAAQSARQSEPDIENCQRFPSEASGMDDVPF